MGKGKPFLEIFASVLHEDYRFPVLEIFAFLYTLGPFVFGNVTSYFVPTYDESIAYMTTSSLLGMPAFMFLFILVILVFKNVAFGLGSDLEKGIFQSYLSYPLKRWRILTSKLLSALGIPLILFLSIQIAAFYIIAPDIISTYLGTVLLTYAAYLSSILLATGIMILVALVLRRGGLALVIGIVLYFALSIIPLYIRGVVAYAMNSPLLLQILSVVTPNFVLEQYYTTGTSVSIIWTPIFSEVLIVMGISYAIIAFLFFLGYYYFTRRLGL